MNLVPSLSIGLDEASQIKRNLEVSAAGDRR